MVTIGEGWVRGALPRRPRSAHKGSFGTLTILAGSARYRGAAVLAAEAALRCGAGIVRVAGIERVCAAVAARLPACTLLPLPENAAGGVDESALPALLAEKHSAILAGCGLGNTRSTAALALGLLQGAACPLLLDADALNALAGSLAEGEDPGTARALVQALDAAEGPVVLTPHMGEMARLTGISIEQVQERQAQTAQSYARAHRCTLVLKSHATVVAGPGEGELYEIDLGGNPGLAKGGSGDVLAGAIAALLAQGLPPPKAAAAGAWLHAEAGRRAALARGATALTPAELPEALAGLMKALERVGGAL